MKKAICVLFSAVILAAQCAPLTAQTAKKVTAKEVTVNMATSECGYANPSTPFFETGGRNADVCYPVEYKNNIIREQPVLKGWRIVVLENEYLRVEFAPELGGMIWRLFDKVHNADVLHAPNKVAPTADGFGGTYTPGGLELNYPYAHSITNTWPRKTEFRENKDGSATYIVSEWERNGRTEWSMEFTLMPGTSRLKQTVILYNRSKLPSGFVYWGNARVPAGPDTKWIEPEAMASEHGGSNLFTWPVFRGIDMSLMINDPEVVGMYFLEPRYNFFGLTNLKTGSGMVHYADRHDVPGKKLWNWGRTPMDGNRKWDAGNHGGSEPHMYGYEYGEVQSGRMVNQDHLEWLLPEECIIWNEAWSPIFGLTDVNEVTEDAAFQLLPDKKKLLVYRFTPSTDIRLTLNLDGRQLKETNLPGNVSQVQEVDLKDIPAESIQKLQINITKGGERSGQVTAESRCVQKKASELREVPLFKEHSSESMADWGEFEHKLLNRSRAIELYEQSIEIDSLNSRAHLGLGKLLFACGDFKRARHELNDAVSAYKWAGEAYLMLSHLDQLESDLTSAEENAWLARYYGEKCRGNIKLGEIAIARSEYKKAKDFLEEAIVNNSRSLRSYALLALCERKLGNPAKALVQLDRTPSFALKDMLWYSEAYLSGKIDYTQLQNELFSDEWRYLELSLDYFWLNDFASSDKIADAGILIHKDGWTADKLFNANRIWGFTRKRETPFFYLVKGMSANAQGQLQQAAELFKKGDYFEHYVNFNQPEMLPVVQAAANAGNGYSDYWLGNYYYHNFKPDEAAEFWSKADKAHPGNPQILRNMAVYAEYRANDINKSYDLFSQALQKNPDDLFMRLQLIGISGKKGLSADQILKLYLDAPKDQRDSYLHLHGLLDAFKAAGKWEDAAKYLTEVDRRWSDDTKSWYLFCIDYADYLINNSKPKEALEWIAKSSPVPSNLSNVNLPVDYWYRHREFYISGLAWKMLGDTSKSREFFEKVVAEPADFLFNEGLENMINKERFYVALAMRELNMEQAARAMMVGINTYRLKQGLVVLKLDNNELSRWSASDPLAEKNLASEE